MCVVVWEGDRVSTRDAVEVAGAFTGARLRDAYRESLPALTLGLIRFRGDSLRLGPIELLRFGAPAVTRLAVTWPIEGGLLARRPGGMWRIQATRRRVEASVSDYTPRLPRPLYMVSHLQVHLLFTHLFLMRLRGREPLPGTPPPSPDRVAAATVDAAFCFVLAGYLGRRRPKRLLAVAAVYHVACWSVSGRTLGGAVMRQRVVSVDGSRLTPQQAALRFALLPVSWIAWRPLHDRIAGTTVIED
jgi:RDD family protein